MSDPLLRTTSQAEFLYHGILHSSKVNSPDGVPDRTAKITCPLCKKQFSKASLRCHLRQHTDERIFPCELCTMSFTRKANRKNHVVNVHAAKEQTNNANQAMIGQLAESPRSAVCSTCGKAFSNRWVRIYQPKTAIRYLLLLHVTFDLWVLDQTHKRLITPK